MKGEEKYYTNIYIEILYMYINSMLQGAKSTSLGLTYNFTAVQMIDGKYGWKLALWLTKCNGYVEHCLE